MIPSNSLAAHPLSRVKQKHPARATPAILEVMARYLTPGSLVLNPFSGTGRFAEIPGINPVLVEIEKDWATHICADACNLPFRPETFDAVAFSPCLTPDQRVLTADLRWIPCGEIEIGDKLLAFDEYGLTFTAKGLPLSRKYRIAEVEQSYRALKECVRVTLETGESITCTSDHPWLVSPYSGRSGLSRSGDRRPKKWTPSNELLGKYVHKAFDVWQPQSSWEAGWLAGIFDGGADSPMVLVVKVVKVESIGMQEIQALTTSTRTYIGEGYLMHNTYGNRFADHHQAKDGSVRHSYTHDIGHPLHPNNSGDKQWGEAYWDLHRRAYPAIIETLKVNKPFILNIKDHYRGKTIIPATEWHVGLLSMLGLSIFDMVQVPVPSLRKGQNHEARVEYEWVVVFTK